MIRKAIIVVLTLGALSVTAISGISYCTPISSLPSGSYGALLRFEEFWPFDRDLVLFRCDRGKAKLVWIHAEEGIRSLRIRHNDNADFAIIYGGWRSRLYDGSGMKNLDQIEHRRYLPRVSWRTKLTIQPPSEWTQIQVWAWMVVAALGAYPAIAFIRGPLRRWRRRRKDLCLKCGYNLEGSVNGVCSECGTTLTPGKALQNDDA